MLGFGSFHIFPLRLQKPSQDFDAAERCLDILAPNILSPSAVVCAWLWLFIFV